MSNKKVKVPSDLTELFKEALINNTYDIESVERSLVKGLENSFAFLYRVQRNKVPFTFFKFKTKERNILYNLNEIEEMIKNYREQLSSIDLNTRPDMSDEYNMIQKKLTELTTVDFGDYYINDRDEVCIKVNHDMIHADRREKYIKSNFFSRELTLNDIYSRPDIFLYYPLFIVDNQLLLDVKIRLENGNTTFVLPTASDSFVIKKDLTFSYHETYVLFIENCYMESVTLSNVQLRYYDNSGMILNKFPKSKLQNIDKISKYNGSFFANIIIENGLKAFPLQYVKEDDEYFYIEYNQEVSEYIRNQSSVTFLFTYFKDLYKHEMYHGFNISNVNIDGNLQSEMILLEEENGIPYSMPIPEANCIILKDSQADGNFNLSHDVSLKLYYPNIYQIKDINKNADTEYKLFYFYQYNNGFNYTPIHDFYYRYLFHLCNHNYSSLECLINAIMKNEYNESTDSEAFRNLFKYILEYRDYRFAYDIFDFVNRPEWTKYPENFKVRKMKEFVQADPKILADYVLDQKKVGNVYHMFVKNVSLTKRFRRTTRFESSKDVIALYDNAILATADTEGALFVVNDVTEEYNYETMIRYSDVKLKNPNINIGDYVTLINDHSSFVFAMKANDHMSKELTLRIYVDGRICTGTVYRTELDMQFIYIPAKDIKPDSYIMIEEYYDTALSETITFTSITGYHEFHVINGSKFMVPTVNDVYLKLGDDVISKENYEVIPVYNNSEFKTTDENGNEITKFANVTNFKLRLLNSDYLYKEIYVRIKKKSFVKHLKISRVSYPRFYLDGLFDRIEMGNIRVYKNGILIPPNMYELQSFIGMIRLQLKTHFDPGDILTVDVTPFHYNHVYHLKDLDRGTVINLKGIINKPLRLGYYDFYSNGKRIGLPHVFYVGAYSITLANLKSLHNFDIYEKERDWEYFGYDQLNADGTYHTYYYDITDLLGESFIDEDAINKVLKEIIDNQKDPDVDIKPNVDEETPEEFDNYHPLEEDLRIFYYEEYLPLGFVNPDEVQFNKDYLKKFYSDMAEVFLVDGSGKGNEEGDVIFTNPDINSDDLDKEYTVMLTGENNLDEYSALE